jgi:2-methylcitrate dehydratase PrpD
MGLVFNRTGGSIEIVETPFPSYVRGLYAAFPSITGVLSAVMAAHGIPGIKTCFEGKAGLFNVYFRGLYDRASLVEDLGRRFEGAGVSFKPWPSCRFSNPYIDATLQLVRTHDLQPADVEQVIVSYAVDKARNCIEPLEARRRPKSPPEAKLSIPFTVALAIVRRKVEIVDFDEDSLRSPDVLELASKVVGRYDAQMVCASKTMLPAVVEIRTRGGCSHVQRVDLVYGHPDKPMSWNDLGSKFRDCARFAARQIPASDAERAIERIRHLESVADMREVVNLVA